VQIEDIWLALSSQLWVGCQVCDGGMVDDGGYGPAVKNCNVERISHLFHQLTGLELRHEGL
jgi:hypothetical protein